MPINSGVPLLRDLPDLTGRLVHSDLAGLRLVKRGDDLEPISAQHDLAETA